METATVTPENADAVTAYSIGELAAMFGVSTQSVRNWECAGQIPRAFRTPGGHRRYDREHVAAIQTLYNPAPSK